MSIDETPISRLTVQVVREDLPDMIAVEARVISGGWSGVASAYVGPETFRDAASRLRR